MHEKTLPPKSLEILKQIESLNNSLLNSFILAGGTGLALQFGHRLSEDFDFFRTKPFEVKTLHKLLKGIAPYEVLQEDQDTLSIIINEVKISFFYISDPFIFDPIPYRFFKIADKGDIALMKLIAISSRGSRKDFVDLYTILRGGDTLKNYFELLPKKYAKGRANTYHILKSLTYFDDAEQEPLPNMLEPFNWTECKNYFVRQAHMLVL